MDKTNLTSNTPTGIYDLLKVSNKKKFHLQAAVKNMELALERIDIAEKDIKIYTPSWNRAQSRDLQEVLLKRLRDAYCELEYLRAIMDMWNKSSRINTLKRMIKSLDETRTII